METDQAPRVLLRQGDEMDIPMDEDPAEVRRVRRAISEALAGADVDADRIQDAMVAISELVSNALVHGGPPRVVRLRLGPSGLLVQVFDGSPGEPHVVAAGGAEPGGRGLQLVSRLAAEWGTRHCHDGKWVWCRVALSA